MVDVFVSYKREDRPKIERLVLGLQKQNLNLWFDARARISQSFIEEINRALNSCKCVIVVWSELAVKSRWVRSEAYHGYERERLIPILIETVEIPVPFNDLQAVDFRGWRGSFEDAHWADLCEAVQSYCQAPVSSKPLRSLELPEDREHPMARTHLRRTPAASPPVDAARDVVVGTLRNAGQPISAANLAHVVRATFPQHVHPFDWLGHQTFRKFIESLESSGVVFDPRPPGLVRLENPAKRAPVVFNAKAASQPKLEPEQLDEFIAKLFDTTEAPLLESKRYLSAFRAIAANIKKGMRTITDITKAARDDVVAGGSPMSRDKISYIYKGSIMGGLLLDDPFVTAEKVGYAFARSVHDECGGLGWQMTPAECDKLLELFGLSTH